MSFGFGIQESIDLAEKIYGKITSKSTKHWQVLADSYLKNKAKLIEHLDPKTGRLIEPLSADLSSHDAKAKVAAQLLYPPSMRWSALDYIEDDELAKGVLSKDPLIRKQLLHVHEDLYKAVKPGMKVTRALSAIFCHYGMTKDAASAHVGKAFESIVVHNKQCQLVVSANILDYLLSSDVSSFTSCHSLFAGGRKAGPFQYLHDETTLIAYLYEKDATYWKVEGGPNNGREIDIGLYGYPALPYKIWRQLIHIDTGNNAVLFMRHYGATTTEDTHKAIRKIVAGVCRHLNPALDGLRWKARDLSPLEMEDLRPMTGHDKKSVAFADKPRSVMSFITGTGEPALPVIQLTEKMPCPRCGKVSGDWHHEQPWCKLCDYVVCATCNTFVRPIEVRNGDCHKCWKLKNYECASCGNVVAIEAATEWKVLGIGKVCATCYLGAHVCPCCKKRTKKRSQIMKNGKEYVCEPCFIEHNANCDTCFANYWREGDTKCPHCVARSEKTRERRAGKPAAAKPDNADERIALERIVIKKPVKRPVAYRYGWDADAIVEQARVIAEELAQGEAEPPE